MFKHSKCLLYERVLPFFKIGKYKQHFLLHLYLQKNDIEVLGVTTKIWNHIEKNTRWQCHLINGARQLIGWRSAMNLIQNLCEVYAICYKWKTFLIISILYNSHVFFRRFGIFFVSFCVMRHHSILSGIRINSIIFSHFIFDAQLFTKYII